MNLNSKIKNILECLIVAGINGFPLHSVAQEHDGSYYCVAEFSGGVAYSENLKKWDSARFRPTEKFVAHFKYAGPHQEDYGASAYVDDYFVTVTPSESDKAETCKSRNSERSDRIMFSHGSPVWGGCETILKQYTFSLMNMRFLTVFDSGYVNGIDSGSDTPSISGGTCTKIP